MHASEYFPFGDMLKTFRTQKHINQQQLADKLAVHRNTIGGWERGEYLPASKGIVMEIIRQLQLNDQDARQLLEASLTAITPYWGVVARRNPYFTGRNEILLHLHTGLSHQDATLGPKAYALSGLGGIGKTQIAIEYAYRYFQEYTAVFWVDARTYGTILSSFASIANLLHLPEKLERDERLIVAAITRWLSSHRDWLFIVDNIEDVALVKRFLPAAPGGSLLLTTNRQALGTLAHSIEVPPMSLEESTTFLLRRAKWIAPPHREEEPTPSVSAAARTLAETLGGLPLALDQAGAYIEETQCHPLDYLSFFRSRPIHLLQQRSKHMDHPLSVAKTFVLAFEQVKLANPFAADLLTFCSFLAADAIPEKLITTDASLPGSTLTLLASDVASFHMALKDLLAYSLLSYNPRTRTLAVHRLVQSVLKAQLDESEQRCWAERAVQTVYRTLPATHEATWLEYQYYIPQISVCADLIDEYHLLLPEAVHLLNLAGYHLYKRARYGQAEMFYQRALEICEQVYGSEHAGIAQTLNNLALLYYMLGRFVDAERLFLRSQAVREHAGKPEYSEIADTLNFLGSLYRLQGRSEEADAAYQRALVLYRGESNPENLLPGHLLYARLLNPEHLAICLVPYKWGGKLPCSQQLYKEWEVYTQYLVALYEQTMGAEHPMLADILLFLALVYAEQCYYAKAEQLYTRVLTIKEQASGPEHPVLADILSLLALIYAEQGYYAKAEQLYTRALTIKERALGFEHHEVADALNNLGKLYYMQGRYDEAKPLYERALTLKEQGDFSEQANTAFILDNLALLHQAQGCYEKAEMLYQRALTIRERLFGPHHVYTMTTRKHYTALLAMMDERIHR